MDIAIIVGVAVGFLIVPGLVFLVSRHRHDWSMWEHYTKNNVWEAGSKYPVKIENVQKRTCLKCGLVRFKKDAI